MTTARTLWGIYDRLKGIALKTSWISIKMRKNYSYSGIPMREVYESPMAITTCLDTTNSFNSSKDFSKMTG